MSMSAYAGVLELTLAAGLWVRMGAEKTFFLFDPCSPRCTATLLTLFYSVQIGRTPGGREKKERKNARTHGAHARRARRQLTLPWIDFSPAQAQDSSSLVIARGGTSAGASR